MVWEGHREEMREVGWEASTFTFPHYIWEGHFPTPAGEDCTCGDGSDLRTVGFLQTGPPRARHTAALQNTARMRYATPRRAALHTLAWHHTAFSLSPPFALPAASNSTPPLI